MVSAKSKWNAIEKPPRLIKCILDFTTAID